MTDPKRPSELGDSILLIYSVDGTKHWLKVTPITELFLDPLFVRFWLIGWGLWAIFYQRVGSFTDASWPPFVVSIALGLVTGIAFFVVAGVLKYVIKLFRLRAIYTPFFLFPVVLAHDVAAWVIYASFVPSDQEPSLGFINMVTQNFISICLLDLIFAHFVAHKLNAKVHIEDDTNDDVPPPPNIAKTDQPEDPAQLENPPEPETASQIAICGIEAEIGKILKIESAGHYLNIHETDHVHNVRGKFSDVMSQLPTDFGIQISRSCWVSKSMITRAEREGSKLLLVLSDQKKLPVARARIPEVTYKLSQWQIEISRV